MDHLSALFSRKASRFTTADTTPALEGRRGPATFANLPYELVENILIYAWHAEPHGLPAGGTFRFYNPHPDDISSSSTTYNLLSENPHNKLSTAAANQKDDQYIDATKRTYARLALVCRTWSQIMRGVVKMYVAIPSLPALIAYARFAGAPIHSSSIAQMRTSLGGESDSGDSGDEQRLSSSHRLTEWVAAKLERVRRPRVGSSPTDRDNEGEVDITMIEGTRRMCRAIHVNVPSGNLSSVPAWADITTLLGPAHLPTTNKVNNDAEGQGVQKEITFDALRHLILTASEPHPGLFALLATGLPSTITTLDIHVSSPYEYARPVLSRPGGIAKLAASDQARRGVQHIQHLLVDLLQIELLEVVLEMFGSFPLLLKAQTDYGRYPRDVEQMMDMIPGEEKKDVMEIPRHEGIYTSPSLKTLTLYGPHALMHAAISDTVSHIPTIHTLTLYRHAAKYESEFARGCYNLVRWDAPKALENEAFFPGLERVIVQMRPFGATSDGEETELAKIRDVCDKRKVALIVERSFRFM